MDGLKGVRLLREASWKVRYEANAQFKALAPKVCRGSVCPKDGKDWVGVAIVLGLKMAGKIWETNSCNP